MSSLPTTLRRQLETAIKQARKIAEGGARKVLEALAVHEPDPYRFMDDGQRDLRRKLRAQAKQLGDGESLANPGAYDIKHLVEKLAYDQWHRLLFARYLLENNLLISPEHGVSVSLDDCEELAPSLGLKDAWAVAARFAARELPEIFRADDPAGAVVVPVEDRSPLIQLVVGLPMDVFTASDSLGWCYQFWQAERKDEVNATGNKIGADELPAVTQLFTEEYMVDFLLDNTLGAWHAGKVFAAKPALVENAQGEEELREAVTLPGCPWKFLRFIKTEDGKWTPAAGAFDGWPKAAKELTCLDPCMGSGHFVVAMFERLVALRLTEETLDESTAVEAVIRDNLFGLEIDPRCTQIAAFNLALAAWRRVGHCALPPMNLACSGLAPNAKREEWVNLAGDSRKLQNGMDRLYQLFNDAPVLGSLINPRLSADNMYVADYHELQPLLEMALAQETKDDTMHEIAVTARGVAKAAEVLAGQFVLVATNVPYLARGKHVDVLKDYFDLSHLNARADLATCFVERCASFCSRSCTTALVTPHSWLFLGAYKELRKHLLGSSEWNSIARLGPGSFETISGEVVNVALVVITSSAPKPHFASASIDVSKQTSPTLKANGLKTAGLIQVSQRGQLANPDSRIVLGENTGAALLEAVATSSAGLLTGDGNQYCHFFWEPRSLSPDWEFLQSSVTASEFYAGRSQVILWEKGRGRLHKYAESVKHLNTAVQRWRTGQDVWGKKGVVASCMGKLECTLYLGDRYDNNVGIIAPLDESHLPAIWAFCSSPQFEIELRRIDQNIKVTPSTFAKIPFDLADWQKVAAEKYPHGLPKPFSSDPTQWLFDGNPKGSDKPLHVALARLVGFQWPRQTSCAFPDSTPLSPDGLEVLADGDGIVCLSATKGEAPAAERLRELLVRAWGKDWNSAVLDALLTQVGYVGKTLDDWLRNGFFEQHCALFQQRPFIWHIWDGNKSGFSALVNYHQLDRTNLEKLTYAYLGDWIRRQRAAVEAGEAGSDARLQAANQLQEKLKFILEGAPPLRPVRTLEATFQAGHRLAS